MAKLYDAWINGWKSKVINNCIFPFIDLQGGALLISFSLTLIHYSPVHVGASPIFWWLTIPIFPSHPRNLWTTHGLLLQSGECMLASLPPLGHSANILGGCLAMAAPCSGRICGLALLNVTDLNASSCLLTSGALPKWVPFSRLIFTSYHFPVTLCFRF